MDARKRLCTACKLILPADFQYCPMCGEPTIEQAPPAPRVPSYEPPYEDDNPILLERLAGALTRRKAVVIAIIALVFIIIAAAAAISLTKRLQSPQIVIPSETATPSSGPSLTPTLTPSPTFVPTPSPSGVPSPTPSPSGVPSPTPSPSGVPSRTPSPSGVPSPTATVLPG
jgi:hypothetical protein